MPATVLFTQGFSQVYDAIVLIRQAMRPGEFRLIASYRSEHKPLALAADTFALEPGGTDDAAYIQWLLEVCRRFSVDVLWPQSRLRAVIAGRELLATAGVALILPCPDAQTLAILDDKTLCAEALCATAVELPRWRAFRTPDEFETAMVDLGNVRVCVKPAVAIYGQGFRILDDSQEPFARFLRNDTFTISREELKTLLAANYAGCLFLAMEYLAGEERSIDCLAADGELVCAVTRTKVAAAQGRWQLLEDDPEGRAIAAAVCRRFGLHGVVNIQTRERVSPAGGRQQCFLEVNPRMSGGISMACQSGVVLPYWALKLALGTAPEQMPLPRYDLHVTLVKQALALHRSRAAA